MPITATGLTQGKDTALTSSKTTASVTLPASTLILLAVNNYVSSGGPDTVSSVTSTGATWELVLGATYQANTQRLEVWRTMVSPNQTGAITINFANVTSRAAWSVISFANVKTTGTHGSDAVLQPTSAQLLFPGPPFGQDLVTLAAFDSVDNATYGAVTVNVSTVSAGSGFTEIHEQLTTGTGGRPGNAHVETEFRNSNDTSVTWGYAGSGNGVGIAAELVFDSGTNTAQALAATSTFTAAISKSYGKILPVETIMSPSITKGIGKALSVASTFVQGFSLASEQIPGQTDVGLAASSVFTPAMTAEKRGIHGNHSPSFKEKTHHRVRFKEG